MIHVKPQSYQPIPRGLRKTILKSCDYTCSKCGIQDKNIDLHHIIPRSMGGLNSINNLRPVCRKCHMNMEPTNQKPLVKQDEFKMTVLLPKPLIKRVKQMAIDCDTSIVSITVNALEDWLKKHPEKPSIP